VTGRVLVLSLSLAAACTGKAIDGGRSPAGGASGKGGAGGGAAMGAGGGNGAMGGAGAEPSRPPGPPPVRCDASVVGARALVRLTAAELTSTLRDLFPEAEAGGGLSLGLSDPLASKDGFIDPGRLLVGEDSAEKLLTAARSIADAVVVPANLAAKFPCAGAVQDVTKAGACAGEVIKRYGRRLFRRPLTSEEQQRYLALHTSVAAKSDFAQGIKWALVALIQSPHALYRRQIGQAMGGGVYKLGQHELASELAYTFTGTTPGEGLLGKADQGLLGNKEALVAEARALIDSPAGRRHMGEFFRLWLGYDLVSANQRDQIPGFAALRDKLAEETRSFIDRVVFTDKGGLGQLLTAPYTTIDGSMATYYGLPAPAGAGFGMVTRPKGQGIGLLAQGSILAERSQSLNSSPTKRGILVRHKFLCLDVPGQPPVVPDLPPPGTGWKTTRERFEAAHAQGACGACHRFFDPLGFPFEHFDEGGRFRQNENGNPIDPSGFAIDGMGQMLFAAKGQEDLATVLAGRPEVAACTAETLVKYLFAQDRDCLAGAARNEFVDGKIGFHELAARIAGEPHFSERRD
jgi:hypothetical protein